jgi:hypothetical protein
VVSASAHFWHYREGEREVDTIVEWPSGEIVGVELKASATVRARDFSGLAHLRDRVGARLRAGPVVYADAAVRQSPLGTPPSRALAALTTVDRAVVDLEWLWVGRERAKRLTRLRSRVTVTCAVTS